MEATLNRNDYKLVDEESDVFFDANDIPVIGEEDIVDTRATEIGSDTTVEQSINSQESFPKAVRSESPCPRPFRNRRSGHGPSTGLRAVTHSVRLSKLAPLTVQPFSSV